MRILAISILENNDLFRKKSMEIGESRTFKIFPKFIYKYKCLKVVKLYNRLYKVKCLCMDDKKHVLANSSKDLINMANMQLPSTCPIEETNFYCWSNQIMHGKSQVPIWWWFKFRVTRSLNSIKCRIYHDILLTKYWHQQI